MVTALASMTLNDLAKGGKRALSEALGLVEHSMGREDVTALLDEAFANPKAQVVGFTGPPGVGKSTLINGLIKNWRQRGQRVGVIAVDPSSHISGGALLGDRTRMITDPEDQGVYVRSLASRGQLGGLAALAFPTLVLMRALYDVVIIETVGVGQSEAEITSHADSVVLCVQPGSGDSLQFMKSGIMEIPDVAVVTKADMGAAASRALADLKGALSLTQGAVAEGRGAGENKPRGHGRQTGSIAVLSVSAQKVEGLDALIDAIEGHFHQLCEKNQLLAHRARQTRHWLAGCLTRLYGDEGYKLVEKMLDFGASGPFRLFLTLKNRLTVTLKS